MKIKTVFGTLAIASCAWMVFGLANAYAETFTVRGTITDTQPVYKTRTQSTPTQKCWTEDVPIYGQVQQPNGGFDLPGAIIGGIIGNNVTKDLPDGGTAGAIIGGLFGNQLRGNGGNQQITGYRTVEKCSTHYDTKSEEYLAGYKITYKAAGFTGTTTRRNNPGVGGQIDVIIRMTAQ